MFVYDRRAEALQSNCGRERLRRKWSGPVTLLTMNILAGGLQNVSVPFTIVACAMKDNAA